MNTSNSSTRRSRAQSGQAIVIIAVVMVGLMGVLGMTIDGGGLYFLHRDTQNAVDAAVVAAIYAKCTTTNLTSAQVDAAVITAAQAAAEDNGFTNGSNGVLVNVDPDYTVGTVDDYVEITITATKPSYFIQLVYKNPLQVTSRAVGFCRPPGGSLLPANSAFIGFSPSTDCSENGATLARNGGGIMRVHGSGIFNNSPGDCNMRSHSDNSAVSADGPCNFVGTTEFDVTKPIEPRPPNTGKMYCGQGQNHPEPLTDLHPLSDIDTPEAECPIGTDISPDGQTYGPGTYGDLRIGSGDNIFFEPGIYCVNSFKFTSSGRLTGTDVVIYMPPGNDGIEMSAHTRVNLKGPSVGGGPCTPGVTCQWAGLLIWSDVADPMGLDPDRPNMNGNIKITGQNNSEFWGMVYAPGSACEMEGGSASAIRGVLACWSSRGEGQSDLDITYEMPHFLYTPPEVMIAD